MAAADEARVQVEGVDATLVELQNAVNSGLRTLPIPQPVVDGIMSAWNGLVEPVNAIVADLLTKLLAPGNEDQIHAIAGRWPTEVGGPVSERAAGTFPPRLKGLDQWSGQAATGYEGSIVAQRVALGAINDHYATTMRTTLDGFAASIVTYWSEVKNSVALMVAGLVAAIGGAIAAETGVGILVAIAGAAAAGAGSGVLLRNAEDALREAARTARNTLTAARAHPAYFDGNWPVAVN